MLRFEFESDAAREEYKRELAIAQREYAAAKPERDAEEARRQEEEAIVKAFLQNPEFAHPLPEPERARQLGILHEHRSRPGLARNRCPILACGAEIPSDAYSVRRRCFYSVEAWASEQSALEKPLEVIEGGGGRYGGGGRVYIAGREISRTDCNTFGFWCRSYGELKCLIEQWVEEDVRTSGSYAAMLEKRSDWAALEDGVRNGRARWSDAYRSEMQTVVDLAQSGTGVAAEQARQRVRRELQNGFWLDCLRESLSCRGYPLNPSVLRWVAYRLFPVELSPGLMITMFSDAETCPLYPRPAALLRTFVFERGNFFTNLPQTFTDIHPEIAFLDPSVTSLLWERMGKCFAAHRAWVEGWGEWQNTVQPMKEKQYEPLLGDEPYMQAIRTAADSSGRLTKAKYEEILGEEIKRVETADAKATELTRPRTSAKRRVPVKLKKWLDENYFFLVP